MSLSSSFQNTGIHQGGIKHSLSHPMRTEQFNAPWIKTGTGQGRQREYGGCYNLESVTVQMKFEKMQVGSIWIWFIPDAKLKEWFKYVQRIFKSPLAQTAEWNKETNTRYKWRFP